MDKFWIFLFLFLAAMAVTAAVCVWIVQRKLRQISRSVFGTDSLLEGLEKQEEQIAETPKSLASMTNVYLPQIMKDFPDFSLEEFRTKSENGLREFLAVLETQEVSRLSGASGELKRQAKLQIGDQKRQGIREQFQKIKIHQTVISRYEKRPGCRAVIFQSAVEYIYGRFRDGEAERKPDRIQTRYEMEWVFIQNEELYREKTGNAGALGANCPFCGAPVRDPGAGFCEYCGAAVEVLNSRVWSLEHIKEDI